MQIKILMVCLGNICRSPLAEGILRQKADAKGLDIVVDSAGTNGLHIGENPDPRSISVARKYGVNISDLKAREFSRHDFDDFDHIFVMDSYIYRDVILLARNEEDKKKVILILNLVFPNTDRAVPDPYYGGKDGFEKMYHLLDKACNQIIDLVSSDKL